MLAVGTASSSAVDTTRNSENARRRAAHCGNCRRVPPWRLPRHPAATLDKISIDVAFHFGVALDAALTPRRAQPNRGVHSMTNFADSPPPPAHVRRRLGFRPPDRGGNCVLRRRQVIPQPCRLRVAGGLLPQGDPRRTNQRGDGRGRRASRAPHRSRAAVRRRRPAFGFSSVCLVGRSVGAHRPSFHQPPALRWPRPQRATR
jgi:hypothetical protein